MPYGYHLKAHLLGFFFLTVSTNNNNNLYHTVSSTPLQHPTNSFFKFLKVESMLENVQVNIQ